MDRALTGMRSDESGDASSIGLYFVNRSVIIVCGFIAVYNRNQVPVNAAVLNRMTSTIAHRGPDDEGTYVEGCVGLGFRRLSILDLQNGTQPLGNAAKDLWIVFNGEIYNYRELKDYLTGKGHVFHTNSDTEVILRLYEEVGTDCPNYLRGMFGFVIWDRQKQVMFAARDPFGIKPVYYSDTPHGHMIGSEIKSLLAFGELDRDVDENAFYHYLTFQYVPEPATIFRAVRKLGAGHSMLIRDGAVSIKPYYKVEFHPDQTRKFSDLVEETRSVLMESVRLHRHCDVPLGAFLSGGIDSSCLVGLLRQLEPTKTFSVGFDAPGYSELELAERTAAYLNTDHHEIRVGAKDFLNALPAVIWHMEEPVADPSAVGLYYVSKLASRYVKVVLSGEGADEFFGGYNIYREPHSLRLFRYMPESMRKMAGQIAGLMPYGMKGKSFLERGSRSLEERFFGNAKIFMDEEKENVLSATLTTERFKPTRQITAPFYSHAENYDDVTKMQYLDIHTWLRGNILMKADKMSMANSLELRVPFIDINVFKVAAATPAKYKVNSTGTKVLLREAVKDIVPPDVRFRKKLGFPVPIRLWLKKELYPWARELIHAADVDRWINKAFVLQMLELHRAGKIDASRKLWTVLVFMLWHQTFIEET